MSEEPRIPTGSSAQGAAGRIGRSTYTFIASSVVRQASMLALLPVLTTRVSPAQYGQVAVASTIGGIAVILGGLGLETPVFRVWFDTTEDPRRRAVLLGTARFLLASSSLLVVAIVSVVVLTTGSASDAWSPWLIILAVIGAAGQSLISSYALPLLRAQNRLTEYLRLQMSIAIAQVVLLAVLVIAISMDAGGWILATVIAQWVGVAIAAANLGSPLTLTADRTAMTGLLRFSLPLVPHALAHWSLAGIDRLVLLAFVPAATVGIYGMVYTVCAIVGTVLTELTRALMNEYGRILLRKSLSLAERSELDALASIQIMAALAVGFGAASLGPPAFRILFADSYSGGAAVIPWIVLGYVLFGIYFVPVVHLTLVEGKTGWLALATAVGAGVNLIANILLIPRLGMIGAAQATAIGYAVMLVTVTVYVRRVSRLPMGGLSRPTRLYTVFVLVMWLSMDVLGRSGSAWRVGSAVVASLVVAAVGGLLVRGQLRKLHPVNTQHGEPPADD